jgi:phosphohistidine swiveling domain-containing protein
MTHTDFQFSTKAKTLKSLENRLDSARIAPLYFFTVQDWNKNKPGCLDKVTSLLGLGPWVVRSSCGREDTMESANAGAYETILNVKLDGLENAIKKVIESYGHAALDDEILIQPMLLNVVRSGVAFSHDPSTCSPYRIINWAEGANTAAVTGGLGGNVWQQAAKSNVPTPPKFDPIVSLIDELLSIVGEVPIDCEFAITQESEGEVLWLLQVRPLILNSICQSDADQFERLKLIEDKVAKGIKPHPFLVGERTVYGIMPDWNPAEMIGIRPKPLALSLYRELITDAIWAYQRNNYGYRNLRSFPLMQHFQGLPYIDVRVSFNSFIPADLDDALAKKLVDNYIDRLLVKPELHDKVEFEIVFSCYTLDLPQKLERLKTAGFSEEECTKIANSLRNLTNNIVHHENGLWRSDEKKLDILNSRRTDLSNSSLELFDRLYWLIEDAKRYGTLPFAGLARAGFIAVQMLKSMVSIGVLSISDEEAFLADVSTVGSKMAKDRAIMDKEEFLSIYGHLRPGTYDILSPRYDEADKLYFDWDEPIASAPVSEPFALTISQMREISRLLALHGLDPDPVKLFDFMKAGIELRELAKFHFSKNLSDTLSLIAEIGDKYQFTREDLAFCSIDIFKELHVGANDPRDLISQGIAQGKARYNETLKISLPPLISGPNDIWAFESPESTPNYITQLNVTAAVTGASDIKSMRGKIICIPNADPGFDWIFSHGIAGLITAWGGANSHMAIRSGELSLPAIIGTGEKLYKLWSSANMLKIDCAAKRVEIVA